MQLNRGKLYEPCKEERLTVLTVHKRAEFGDDTGYFPPNRSSR